MIGRPSNIVLVFMTLVVLHFPSSNQSENDEKSPICNDKTQFGNGQGISFPTYTNFSNNFIHNSFQTDEKETSKFDNRKRKLKDEKYE